MTAVVAAPERERPILFSAEMVRAILDGRKTQTRRVVQMPRAWARAGCTLDGARADGPSPFSPLGEYLHVPKPADGTSHRLYSPYGVAGERLWVREAWGQVSWTSLTHGPKPPRVETVYRAGPHPLGRDVPHGWTSGNRWRPSIHMPRSASRLTLELTEVRVERLQAISDADVLAEGVTDGLAYVQLWDGLNAPRGYGWNANPWVWVLGFRPVEAC